MRSDHQSQWFYIVNRIQVSFLHLCLTSESFSLFNLSLYFFCFHKDIRYFLDCEEKWEPSLSKHLIANFIHYVSYSVLHSVPPLCLQILLRVFLNADTSPIYLYIVIVKYEYDVYLINSFIFIVQPF